jgi:hypothetical protein
MDQNTSNQEHAPEGSHGDLVENVEMRGLIALQLSHSRTLALDAATMEAAIEST